uniref:Uncharacterized protein n=1 Tax=Anguilla anguilla TaxID=7936 RepID=A0A0E9R7W0_ANGAN
MIKVNLEFFFFAYPYVEHTELVMYSTFQ